MKFVRTAILVLGPTFLAVAVDAAPGVDRAPVAHAASGTPPGDPTTTTTSPPATTTPSDNPTTTQPAVTTTVPEVTTTAPTTVPQATATTLNDTTTMAAPTTTIPLPSTTQPTLTTDVLSSVPISIDPPSQRSPGGLPRTGSSDSNRTTLIIAACLIAAGFTLLRVGPTSLARLRPAVRRARGECSVTDAFGVPWTPEQRRRDRSRSD